MLPFIPHSPPSLPPRRSVKQLSLYIEGSTSVLCKKQFQTYIFLFPFSSAALSLSAFGFVSIAASQLAPLIGEGGVGGGVWVVMPFLIPFFICFALSRLCSYNFTEENSSIANAFHYDRFTTVCEQHRHTHTHRTRFPFPTCFSFPVRLTRSLFFSLFPTRQHFTDGFEPEWILLLSTVPCRPKRATQFYIPFFFLHTHTIGSAADPLCRNPTHKRDTN